MPDEWVVLPADSFSRLTLAQVWAGQTNGLVAFKRPMLQTRLQAGLSRLRDLSHR